MLNVHGAVACAECAWSSCMCMSSECESYGEHSTTLIRTQITPEVMTLKIYSCMHFTALKQSGR